MSLLPSAPPPDRTDTTAALLALLEAVPRGVWEPCGNDREGCQCGMIHDTTAGAFIGRIYGGEGMGDDPDPRPTPDGMRATARLVCALFNAAPSLLREAQQGARREAALREALSLAAIPLEVLLMTECDAEAKALTSEVKDAIRCAVAALRAALSAVVDGQDGTGGGK